MNLISCRDCGVVLDKNVVRFPENIWDYGGSIDETKGTYSQFRKEWVAFISCPVCNEKILDD